jgi:hypothetical protein
MNLTYREELAAFNRLRRRHELDCMAAFVAGVGFGAVVVLLILHWTGGV